MAREATPDVLAGLARSETGQSDGDALAAAMGPQVMALNISAVRLDGGTQPRAGIDRAVVEDYAHDMEANGAEFPPVQVVYDGAEYWLWDGFHRLHARKRNGLYTVPAIVRQGTRRDAVLLSVGANATHGFRRTTQDKQRAVETLLRDAEWSQWSDREIARRCAVDGKTVGARRAALSAEIPQIETRRVERNGTEYTMTPPQRSAAPAVASEDAKYMTVEGLTAAVREWSEMFEEPLEAATGLFRDWVAGRGSYLEDWTNSAPAPWKRNDLQAAIREVQGVNKPPAAQAAQPDPVQVQPTREERMAAALEYDRQRKELQRCAVDTFIAYAEDHCYTGILRWLAYRVHETAQWDDLTHLTRRDLWRLIGDSLIGLVMARYDAHTSLERLREVVDERFNDAGLNGVLWPEEV